MIKKSFSLMMIVLVLFSYFVRPLPVEAAKNPETLQDLLDILNEKKRERAENDAKKDQAKKEIEEKKNAIAKAEEDIHQAEKDIEEANQKIEESDNKIKELNVATEKSLKALQQMKSKNAYLQYLSDSASITEFIMRIRAMEQINVAYQKSIDNLNKLIEENKRLKIELKNKQDELERKIPEYQSAIESLYGDIDNYDKFAPDLAEQVRQAENNFNLYKEASLKIYGKVVYTARLADLMENNSMWLKPLNSGTVTSPMGYRTHPVSGVKYSFHSGIDIGRVSEGTAIYAAAGGRVSGIIRYSSCGGNMVYVDVVVNGKQYTTYYYHLLSINVSVGQTIDQNTIIGTVGGGPRAQAAARSAGKKTDGCSTGAHLHFGVMTGAYTGSTPASRVIVPPGFNNAKGYNWSNRFAYYGNR